MDVLLSENEEMIRNLAREFLQGECPTSLVRDMEKDDLGYSQDMWKKVASELGWTALSLPEEYGGLGETLQFLGLIFEEVGRHMAPVPLLSTMVAALTILRDGSETIKKDILPQVASGDLILTYSFQERDPRLVESAVKTTATADGSDYVINGKKLFVDNFNQSDKMIVTANTGKGLTLFLVDTGAAGISSEREVPTAKDKQFAVIFDNVKVSADNIIGKVDNGWDTAQYMLDLGAVFYASQMCGAARKDFEMALEYSKNRVAFGRPIGAFQSVAHMLADAVMFIDGGELLTREAIWKIDQGQPYQIEVSQAKAFCNDKLQHVTVYSQMIHGGMGFMMEFDLHLWYRRVAAWSMRMGTTFEHRSRVAKGIIDSPDDVLLGKVQTLA
jgi:alkylation response protein AidB-like acyl-CoA dehydrogenase|tara:strand:- start:2019 stop:3176 length:1158 start_codon:yes stop_codon:yes gene_type:complete